jgi:hypothetical protein
MEADTAGNVFLIRYFGAVTVAHMESSMPRAEQLLGQMRSGFTVLSDLTGLEVMELACSTYLTRMMELFKARGVGMVIRVIPDPSKDIGLNILSLIHFRGKVKIVTCATMAEAKRAMK